MQIFKRQTMVAFAVGCIGSLSLITYKAAAQGISLEESRRMEQAIEPSIFPGFDHPPARRLLSDQVTPLKSSADSDGDGLSDQEENKLKTDPNKADTDGDGLLDGWEVLGVNGLDLRKMGASPLHKDIFVEMDFMVKDSAVQGLAPTAQVIERIVNVFANAPVSNPDGIGGIALHLELKNQVTHDHDLNPVADEFIKLKKSNFDLRRAPVYHYMIWADQYNGGTSSGKSFGIPGSDFVVTLGAWDGGSDDEKVGTFVHELGHNLGLMHGGSDSTNEKPNHLSVMNYFFQLRGIPFEGRRLFGYQALSLPELAEVRLDEQMGIGRTKELRGYSTRFYTPNRRIREVAAHESIDWNASGLIEEKPISQDLNGDKSVAILKGTTNEWQRLVFNGGTIGNRNARNQLFEYSARIARTAPAVEELTREKDLQIESSIER